MPVKPPTSSLRAPTKLKPPARRTAGRERAKASPKPARPTSGPSGLTNGQHVGTEGHFKTQIGADSKIGRWVIVETPATPPKPQPAPRDGRDTLGNADSANATSDGLGVVSHTKTQAAVGGTKGSPKPIDRSEANKKAWITRRSLYGSSGKKST